MTNRRGFSLVEVLVAASILGVVSGFAFSGFLQITKSIANMETLSQKDQIVADLYSQVRNIVNQIDSSLIQAPSNINDLPMQWDSNRIYEPTDSDFPCAKCVGRLGYTIQSQAAGAIKLSGLYVVTVHIHHPDYFGPGIVDYKFLVSSKK